MTQTASNGSQVVWSTGQTHRLLDLARAQTGVRAMRSAIYAAQQELAAEEQKHLQRIADLEAELAQAKGALVHPAGAPTHAAVTDAVCQEVAQHLQDTCAAWDGIGMLDVREVVKQVQARTALAATAAAISEQESDHQSNEIDWDNLPEDPRERAMFDRNLDLYGGDPRVAIATSLSIWANTRGNGSFGLMCAVFANEVAKLHIAPTQAVEVPDEREGFEAWFLQKGSAHQLERNQTMGWYENLWANAGWEAWQARAALAASRAGVPASELGLTRERIAQIAATYFHQDETELGDMKTAIRVALREAASAATCLPADAPEAARTQATAALNAQAAPTLELTDEELTTIYKTANNEVGKARPLTTESIFKAMRAVAALTTARALGASRSSAPTLDTRRLGGWCETHLGPKPCWHCQQVEKREVVAGLPAEATPPLRTEPLKEGGAA